MEALRNQSTFDLRFVRRQFPAFSEPTLDDAANSYTLPLQVRSARDVL